MRWAAPWSHKGVKLLVGELTLGLPDRAARRAPPKGRHPPAAPAPNRQALLVLAHLRCGDTYTRLAASFGIGVATVHRYIREAVDLLAALVPTLQQALNRAAAKAFVLLDGTLLPMDRIAADRPFYSGKHRKHGMNVPKSSPARSAACCGPPPRCPAPCTASRRPAPTASSTPRPRSAWFATATRATRAPAAPYGCPSVANTATSPAVICVLTHQRARGQSHERHRR